MKVSRFSSPSFLLFLIIGFMVSPLLTGAAQANHDPLQASAEFNTPQATETVATNTALDRALVQYDDKKLQEV